ncbi:MAG: hypothetical protein ACLSHJ_03200 [Oscillospiraceae bacterium]
MKRNDWAGGFWAKAAAFFLAVVLVPVLLSYGAALAFSYSGELRGDFYKSSICSSAVYREMSHVYDSYHYYAENGQTEVLAKYDDWYPADDRYTNVRFSIEDEAGTILFDNHRTGDIPVTGWWGEMAQDGVVFRSYIAADYPAQDNVYRARDFYYTMTRLAPHAAAVVIACAAAELFLFIFLARAAGAGRGARRRSPAGRRSSPLISMRCSFSVEEGCSLSPRWRARRAALTAMIRSRSPFCLPLPRSPMRFSLRSGRRSAPA